MKISFGNWSIVCGLIEKYAYIFNQIIYINIEQVCCWLILEIKLDSSLKL